LAKKDNPGDYKANLQEHIDHTVANLHEAETYLDEHASEISADKKYVIEAKNYRREDSIKGFKASKKDEVQH